MGNFDQTHKNEPTYLDIAANGNGAEKAYFTAEAIRRTGNLEAHIIEIGPGGGSAVDSLIDQLDGSKNYDLQLSLVELESIHSESLDCARAKFESTLGRTTLHTADARLLTEEFPESSVDIITGSAVLHEIYSYGHGYGGLHQAMDSIATVLKPGGHFAYRDVYAVPGVSLHEKTIQAYGSQGWLNFIKSFTPHYLKNATHPYHRNEDELQFRQDSRKVGLEDINTSTDVIVEGPIGIFREIQRHYITFRDQVWRSGILGFKPELDGELASDWLDIKNGHKRIHYELTDSNLLTQNQRQLLVAMSEQRRDHYVIDCDIFDTVTDTAINDFFVEIAAGNKLMEQVWEKWLDREGSETYAYMTLDQLLGTMAIKSIEADCEENSIMLPVMSSDVVKAPRAYYNRLLSARLPNPLFDGKQLVLFKKIPLSDTEGIQAGLSVVQSHGSKATLSNLYSRISRKV